MILTKYALFGSNNVTRGRVKIILYFKKRWDVVPVVRYSALATKEVPAFWA
jgi:hypothetical protein